MTRDLQGMIEERIIESGVADHIQDALTSIKNVPELIGFFRQFSQYNMSFPGAVASLAGAIHVRHHLFSDETDPIFDNRDRSSVIASNIMFAAEDEFATRDRSKRLTHRMMAQNFVKELISFYDISYDDFNKNYGGNDSYLGVIDALKNGYRVESIKNDEDLFFAIGFHLGSERLADIEFNIVDKMMKNEFSEFVKHATICRGQFGVPIYSWILMHTTVEVDHYLYSLLGANDALMYYKGDMDLGDLENTIMAGFGSFINFQKLMFNV